MTRHTSPSPFNRGPTAPVFVVSSWYPLTRPRGERKKSEFFSHSHNTHVGSNPIDCRLRGSIARLDRARRALSRTHSGCVDAVAANRTLRVSASAHIALLLLLPAARLASAPSACSATHAACPASALPRSALRVLASAHMRVRISGSCEDGLGQRPHSGAGGHRWQRSAEATERQMCMPV